MISSNDFFHLSTLPMWIVDVQANQFLEVNEAALEAFSYTRTELLSLSPADLSDEKEILRLKSILDAALHATIFYKEVKAFVKKDGNYLIAELEQSQITYKDVVCNLILVLDITIRIQNEIRIRESKERFDVVSKATSDTIWDMSLATETIVWNKGIKGIFGHKSIENNTTTCAWFRNCIHPEDHDIVVASFWGNLDKETSRWKDEFRFKCEDGTFKYVLTRNFVIHDNEGKASRVIGAMEDISKRKEEEHWSKLLESVVINTTDGVIITNADHNENGPKIMYVNMAYAKMIGYTKEELVGATPQIFAGHEVNKPALEKLFQATKKLQSCDIEVLNIHKSGNEFWVSINVSPVTDSNGKVTHWISIQRDITESRNYLKAIEDQNKKFKEIAWIQSHVVRAPLARVMGLVDLLSQHTPGDETVLLLEHLSTSAKDLDAIITNIADRTPMINVN